MERSVHDNLLLSYTVDAEKAEVTLRTAFRDHGEDERTGVIFTGVEAYDFECDNFQNILFNIVEVELSQIYDRHRERFERLRDYGWPNLNFHAPEQLLDAMREARVRAFEIQSSVGLHGWVWARSMEMRAV